ncbi:MAG: dimethylarginine dimethylaminohydrolase family protein [Betaproteobacteria bacterium]
MKRIALTRGVSPAIGRCELTYLERVAIDVDRARAQHEEYERLLAALGCGVQRIPASPGLPDSVFVEDVAVVVDEVAVLTRPGAESRRLETAAVAERLSAYRTVATIDAPGTLDGGDVIVAGRDVFVGRGGRSNEDGIAQLRAHLDPFGYRIVAVAVRGCLHLKSAATLADETHVLLNPDWVDPLAFGGLDPIEVDPAEPHGANVLRVGRTLVCAAAFPRTKKRLERLGLTVRAVDLSELAKAEGAVTCCSIVFPALPSRI